MAVFKCDGCFKLFGSKQFLVQHQMRKGCEKSTFQLKSCVKCSICHKVFLNKTLLTRHYARHIQEAKSNKEHNQGLIVLKPTGSNTVNSSVGNEEHSINKTEANPNQSWTCNECGQSFAKECSLARHQNIHAKEMAESKKLSDRQFACSDCNSTFTKRCYLTSHYNRTHLNSGLKKRTMNVAGNFLNDAQGSSKSENLHRSIAVNKQNVETNEKVLMSASKHEDLHGTSNESRDGIVSDSVVLDLEVDEIFDTEVGGSLSPSEGESNQEENTKESKPYACDQCSETFSRKFSLEDHQRLHLNLKSFVCSVCGDRFNRQNELTKHRRTHPGVKPYACHVCHKEYNNHGVLRRHLKIHTQEKNYICEVCGRGFIDPSGLKSHRASHSDERPYKCSNCDTMFKSTNSLRLHVQYVHEKKTWFKCDACDKKFTRKGTFVEHLKRHLRLNSHFCDECDEGFPSSSELSQHRLKHGGLRYKCDICDKDYGRKYDLKVHKRVHSGERPYSCQMCDMTFYTKHNLVRHELLHSIKESMNVVKNPQEQSENQQVNDDDNQPLPSGSLELDYLTNHGNEMAGQNDDLFTCQDCGRMFVKKHNFLKHMNERHTTAVVTCNLCDLECHGAVQLGEHIKNNHFVTCSHCKVKFADQDALDKHFASAHPDRRDELSCDICGEQFTQASRLKSHREKHPEARDHICEKCNASFTRLRSLHIHMLSHADVLPHCCQFCDLKFYLKETLDKHIKRKHTNRPIKCPLCPRSFKSTAIMFKHQKVHRNITKPFRCEICLIGFGTEIHQRRHMKRFHPETLTDIAFKLNDDAAATNADSATAVSEQGGVTLHIPEDSVFANPDNSEMQYLTQYTGLEDNGDGTVTYIVLKGTEDQDATQSDGQQIFLSSLNNALIGGSGGSLTTSLETGIPEESAVPNDNESQSSTDIQDLPEMQGNDVITEETVSLDTVGSPNLANQIRIDHSYLSPGPHIIYVSPTDVVLGGDVDVIMEVCDSEKIVRNSEEVRLPDHQEIKEEETSGLVRHNADDSGPAAHDRDQVMLDEQIQLKNTEDVFGVQPDVAQETGETGQVESDQYVNTTEEQDPNMADGPIGNKKKVHKCRICGNSYLSKRQLTCHFRSAHPNESSMHCEYCNKDFRKYNTFREHMFIHRGLKADMCHICGKAFLSKGRLLKHFRTHEDIKRYQCQECGKTFKQSGSLRKHLVTHGAEKNFECEICQKRFYHEGHLKEHLARHYNIRPYKCDQCEKTFVTSSNLNVHRKSHLQGRKQRGRPALKKSKKAESKGRKVSAGGQSLGEGSENVVTFGNLQLVVGEQVVVAGEFSTVSINPVSGGDD